MTVARLAMVLSDVIEQLMDRKIIDQNFSQLNMGLFFHLPGGGGGSVWGDIFKGAIGLAKVIVPFFK